MDELIPVGLGDDEEGVAAGDGDDGDDAESTAKAGTGASKGGKARVKTPALA
jgi:hypothetical protein